MAATNPRLYNVYNTMNMLGLAQQHPLIRKELSRRIGYTNGLHDIFRFGRIVSYLHRIAPASAPALRAVVLEKEDVQGTKYADGIIEVAGALGLIAKVGAKLTLADNGYALHAVRQVDHPPCPERAMLLNAILESDGDATLNLLDLIATSPPPELLGPLLLERLLMVIQLREAWTTNHVEGKFARDLVLQHLSDARARLQQAVDLNRKHARSWSSYSEGRGLSPEQRIARFYDHTVTPRRGWLRDLGCVVQTGTGQYEATVSGLRLLAAFKDAVGNSNSTLVLPFSSIVMDLLGVVDVETADDLLWKATARFFKEPPSSFSISTIASFHLIKEIYPQVKLHVFNEATVESIYHVIAARLAVDGEHLDRQTFEKQIDVVCSEHSESMYRLRNRQGGSGYIALRGSLG